MLPSNTLKHSGALRAGALLAALTLLLSGCGAGTDVQTRNVGTRTVETAQYAGAETHHTSSENLVFVTSSGLVELYYDSVTDEYRHHVAGAPRRADGRRRGAVRRCYGRGIERRHGLYPQFAGQRRGFWHFCISADTKRYGINL